MFTCTLMKHGSISSLRALLLLACLTGWTACLFATPITITHSGTGSGTIGTNSFVSANYVITENADTANRIGFTNGYFIDDTSASIFINGLGTFSFTTGTRTFVENFGQVVGFSHSGLNGFDLIDSATNAAFSNWNMLSSIGPISGTAHLLQWDFLPFVTTTGGTLKFDTGLSTNSVFQAVVVPEPAPWALAALGFCGVALLKTRRR